MLELSGFDLAVLQGEFTLHVLTRILWENHYITGVFMLQTNHSTSRIPADADGLWKNRRTLCQLRHRS